MITAPAFKQLADVLANATQDSGVDPDEIRNAVEGIEDFCLGMEERIDGQKALIVALEGQLERLERRLDRQAAR